MFVVGFVFVFVVFVFVFVCFVFVFVFLVFIFVVSFASPIVSALAPDGGLGRACGVGVSGIATQHTTADGPWNPR